MELCDKDNVSSANHCTTRLPFNHIKGYSVVLQSLKKTWTYCLIIVLFVLYIHYCHMDSKGSSSVLQT